MAKLTILVDINIVMDIFTHRQPFYAASAGVWNAVESGRVDGLIAAHSVTTLFYLVKRYTNHQKAILSISDLLRVFQVAPVNQNVLLQAMALNWRDYEDAVQVCAAIEAGGRCIVSRDVAGFTGAALPVLSPADLLQLLDTP
jgi:predicted nucleic acid-binding protein